MPSFSPELSECLNCPECQGDWQGDPIPEPSRRAGYYGPPEGASTHFSRLVGVEIRGVYDGVSRWECPDCHAQWNRWSAELVRPGTPPVPEESTPSAVGPRTLVVVDQIAERRAPA